MNRSFRVAAIAAVALGLAACSTTPSTTATATAPAAPAAPARMAEPGQTTAPSARSTPTPAPTRAPVMALPAHQDPASAIYRERLVYFDFDSYLLDAADQALVERHARYLVTAAPLSVRVEGHADERGGAEYNLALGQRRAEAVRRAMSLLGVDAARIEATSWGEERPRHPGHDEAAWTQNRRAEIVYRGPGPQGKQP
jgi:peptidoglycan-associated lipoprotein